MRPTPPIELGPTHGTGITGAHSNVIEDRFITWAGPWTEARFARHSDPDMFDSDQEGLCFANYLSGVPLGQPSDLPILIGWVNLVSGSSPAGTGANRRPPSADSLT